MLPGGITLSSLIPPADATNFAVIDTPTRLATFGAIVLINFSIKERMPYFL
jgi:hypothetical protein